VYEVTLAGATKVIVPDVVPLSNTPDVNSSESNSTSEVVAISWGRERVTPPVDAEAITRFAVPVILVTPELERVTEPPNDTDPPPESPDPAETVIEEEESAEVGILEKVLLDPEIVLLVKVCETLSITKLPAAESVGIETVKAPEPLVCVEIIVLASVIWFDAPERFIVLPAIEAKLTADEVKRGWSMG
jgi:hypothetical protein